MKRLTRLTLCAVAAAGLATRAGAQCQYELTVIQAGPANCDPFPPSPTHGSGINESTQVVGSYTVCAIGSDEAFLWDGGPEVITLERPPGVGRAWAADINDAGLIVGTMACTGMGDRAFLHGGAQFIDLGTLRGGNLSRALAINSHEQIVGVWGNNVVGNPGLAAFLWQDGVMLDLNPDLGTPDSEALDINDAGQVVGWMGTSKVADAHAFLWQDGAVTDLGVLPGGFAAGAAAIDNLGRVVGWSKEPLGKFPFATSRAFLWQGTEMIDLGTLPGFEHASATDINDAGQIVGVAWGVGGNLNIQAAIIRKNGIMTDLNDLIAPGAGLTMKVASAINNAGQITGWASAPAASPVAVLLTPVGQPPGDLDGDCTVGISDFGMLIEAWGPCPGACPPSCAADLDGDCDVGIVDFLALLANWG